MSLMAGVFRRRADAAPLEQIARQLQDAVSRDPEEPRQVIQSSEFFLVKIDYGFFDVPGVLERPDLLAGLCGEPLAGEEGNRLDHLAAMSPDLFAGDTAGLARSRGSFALACYDPSTRTLLLATDKVGVRPLFVWVNRDYVVFASQQRVLEAVAGIPKVLDLQGMAELSEFDFPLGDRTPYQGIRLLRSGTLVRISEDQFETDQYHRWDRVPSSIAPELELAEATYQRFREAVSIRRRGETKQYAFLSGGLDSRCVVSQLRADGCEVHTYGYGLDHSQELAFTEAFAKVSGVHHRRVPVPPGSWAYPRLSSPGARRTRAEMMWSGDGGSVGLGHVYLTREIVNRSRAGDRSGAIAIFRAANTVGPGRRFLASWVPDPDRNVTAGILEELSRYDCDDPARLLFYFLLENDQRRHLIPHFESLDLHRQEFQVPFFDSELLTTIIAVPIDWCLGHYFYSKVLRFFPPVTVSVPWQTYPGHDPCPLPAPPGLGYQWRGGGSNPRQDARRLSLLQNTRRILQELPFPSQILNWGAIWAAYWLTRLRIRNYEYALQAASVYERHWRIADAGVDSPFLPAVPR